MTPKSVFLDVDGTLVDEAGQIPDSARRAVREARANGHRVFLCTGRSLAELWPEIIDIGFDGLVAAAGAYVQVRGEVLRHDHIDPAEIQHVVDFFDPLGVQYYFQGTHGIYGSPGIRPKLRQLITGSVTDEDLLAELQHGLFRFINSIIVDADPRAVDITKAIYVDATVPIDAIRAEFAGNFDVIPSSVPMFGPNSGEMQLPGVHKATGIDVVLEHLGIDRGDTIALGDSYNDLEMLEHVGVGIAMGNAPQRVRDVADETTAAPDDDGILLAFRRHHLVAR